MSNIVRKIITSPHVTKPRFPYSHGVQVDQTLYIAGQVGLDYQKGGIVSGGVVNETKQALVNMGHILEGAGIGFGNVVKTTVLLADIKDMEAVNEVYKQFFKEPYPARAAYQAANLPLNARVEIEAVAVVGKIVDAQ
ncbi:2-iminobutanoate/2-iminopropanoate deaminase [Chamberlinius hualienensis]